MVDVEEELTLLDIIRLSVVDLVEVAEEEEDTAVEAAGEVEEEIGIVATGVVVAVVDTEEAAVEATDTGVEVDVVAVEVVTAEDIKISGVIFFRSPNFYYSKNFTLN